MIDRQTYSPDVETSVTPLWTSSDENVSHSLLTSHIFLILFDTGYMPNGYLLCIFMCVFNFAFNFYDWLMIRNDLIKVIFSTPTKLI